MGIFAELFVRNRAPEAVRNRRLRAMLDAAGPTERAYIDVRPADFPRLAREASVRGR